MVNELNWLSVSCSEIINSNFRLEASVFNIEAKKAKASIENCKYPLKNLCGKGGVANVYHRGRFKRIYVDKSNFPIFQPSQITEIRPIPYLFLSKKTETNIDALRVKKGQILMTCSGTIGKLAIVTDRLNNQIFSHDLFRITATDPEYVGYIYAYLKSKIGQTFLTTNNYGAVIQHLEPEHLENVPIPIANDKIRKTISLKIEKSFELRDQSNLLVDLAEKKLSDALQIPSLVEMQINYFDISSELKNFSTNFNLLEERLDASYHVPIINSIFDILLDNAEKILPVGNKEISKKIVLPGRFKRTYVDVNNGSVFLGGKQIHELDPYNKKYLSIKKHAKRIADQLYLHENMIVITCSGTIGKVNIIPKHWENWTMSQHVLRIIPTSPKIAGYLYIWLNSEFGRSLIERHIYGSVVDEIDDKHLANVPVPILYDKNIMQQINNLALDANKLRSEAYFLEKSAIEQVENEVIFT